MTTGKATFRASNSPQGLTENMQILTGQKGDRLDKALTLREAAAIGMVNLRRNGSGQIVPELPPATSGDPEWSGVQQPVAPTGVTVDGAFHAVTLTWDAPAYNGHAFAEVWRAQENNLAKAVRVGTTLANVYSDAVGKGFKAFYWVRFVNKNAFAGPYQSTGGIPAETSRDVDSIIASANNFAIYNPAKPDQKEIIFGVTDDGKVAIREAVIKAATIQILTSEKITADYVKAGVSISSPLISGGSIDMGNAFLHGGAAGFGKGGPYGGWSWTWHTIIYADGSLYTDRLFASNGSFTGTVNANAGTFQNVTIEETCNVKGTVYANKIVGDVLSAKVVSANSTGSAGSGHVVASASVKGWRTHAANLYCLGVTVEVYASGGYRPGGNDQDVPATISGRLVLTNSAGGIIATAPFKVRSGSNISIAAASQSITIQGGFDAGTGAASISCAVIIDSQSASYGGSAGVRVPAQSIAFCLLPSGSQFN